MRLSLPLSLSKFWISYIKLEGHACELVEGFAIVKPKWRKNNILLFVYEFILPHDTSQGFLSIVWEPSHVMHEFHLLYYYAHISYEISLFLNI